MEADSTEYRLRVGPPERPGPSHRWMLRAAGVAGVWVLGMVLGVGGIAATTTALSATAGSPNIAHAVRSTLPAVDRHIGGEVEDRADDTVPQTQTTSRDTRSGQSSTGA
jgi:hypothetical protein